MSVRLVSFPVAGGGGRAVHINPSQVVCVMDAGAGRAQIVTTGLSGENSISLVVETPPKLVAQELCGIEARPA
jgi:hypothetical protein